MLKTILLLDGSEAVNCSADYLPTRLLALRPQLNRFVHAYLDGNPLASLGVVVMRDGVAHRLSACTTNASEIIQSLEVKYFLFGGSGAMSLENGLRLSLSELVDLKRIAKRAKQVREGDSSGCIEAREESTARLRIILVSSSVTLIDPHDVFVVLKVVTRLRVRVDVISFCGAVHVLDEVAVRSSGLLHTPMNYDHLTDILRALSTPEKGHGYRDEKQSMIRVGFPVYIETEGEDESKGRRYLACPQCALIQTSIPSTCPLCKLQLCSLPLVHTTFIAHNELCPPSERCEGSEGDNRSHSCDNRCSLCQDKMRKKDSDLFWRCSKCRHVRCNVCERYIREGMGLCPTCVSSAP